MFSYVTKNNTKNKLTFNSKSYIPKCNTIKFLSKSKVNISSIDIKTDKA